MKENVVERTIMWGDLDSLGIVFYPRYYEWIDACGHLFFKAIHINLGDLLQDRQIVFGLVETSCRYLLPGRYNQKIRIITRIDSLGDKVVCLNHTIEDSGKEVVLVEGREKRICLDVSHPESFRAIAIPEDIYALLEKAK